MRRLSPLLATGLLLLEMAGCPGEGPGWDAGQGQPRGRSDSGAAAPASDGAVMTPTAEAGTGDAGACPEVPAGSYRGKVTGDRTGTIAIELRLSGGKLVLAPGSNITFDKVFPLVLGTIVCGKLEATIARPEGSTGGTDYRGGIRGTYLAAPTPRFKGDWNMPGDDQGTFTAKQ